MKTNAILLALLIFCMSLAGCISQTDGVAEVTLTDDQVDAIVDEHLEDFLANVSIVVNEEITNYNNNTMNNNNTIEDMQEIFAFVIDKNKSEMNLDTNWMSITFEGFNTDAGYIYEIQNIVYHVNYSGESTFPPAVSQSIYIDSTCGNYTESTIYYTTYNDDRDATLDTFVTEDCTNSIRLFGESTTQALWDEISYIHMEIILSRNPVTIM